MGEGEAPRINVALQNLPLRRVVEGRHFFADLSLPCRHVLYDYLRQGEGTVELEPARKRVLAA